VPLTLQFVSNAGRIGAGKCFFLQKTPFAAIRISVDGKASIAW
jgi:sulfatase maturation enzyme AslB (radical SAM superfamily)